MMRIIAETARRWRLPLICFAWMFTFLGLLLRKSHETFLSANFLPIIILATVALAPLAIFSLLRRTPPRFGAMELLGTAVILLPLVHIYHSAGMTLGAGAFAARYVGAGGGAGNSSSSGRDAADDWGKWKADPDAPNAAEPETDDEETSLLDLFENADQYNGRKVTVTGMLAKDNPQVEQVLGVKQPILFRFAINCCAADAVPLALVLECDDSDLKNDDWIKASGTFRIRPMGKLDLVVLENAIMQPAMRPRQPYLYSQWGLF
ncbi:MAG: hypothetical protein LBT97_00235 [Planctomycetota bacterium]|jgi:uncharacterized repeat protein (TIGR03943 family)|nr:hypothetical protein [Planctomycetota bacterium]